MLVSRHALFSPVKVVNVFRSALVIWSLAALSVYAQTPPPADGTGFIADTIEGTVASVNLGAGDESLAYLQTAIAPKSGILDLAVDRANRRLYVLATGSLKVFDINSSTKPATLTIRHSVDVSGRVLALSLDARTAFIGGKGKVTAINLYPEFAYGSGKWTTWDAYARVRPFTFEPELEVAAMAVHPAGDRLVVVFGNLVNKLDLRNDLLRTDVNSGSKTLDQLKADGELPEDFGFITQLDISDEVQTRGATKAPPKFATPVGLKDLIYPQAVALGIRNLAFSPDGNYALLTAVGAGTPRATAFGIMPTSDEGTGGIVVLDLRPQPADKPWVRYLAFIPTTEREEKTTELRREVQREGWKIVHPQVQWARNQYLSALGQAEVGIGSSFTALPTLTGFTVAAIVLDEMERSYADYGYMQAYFNLYPRDMVGASSVAISHSGDFGVVTLQDTNNLGLLSVSLSNVLTGFGEVPLPPPPTDGAPAPEPLPPVLPDFFIKRGTGKSINGFDAALTFAPWVVALQQPQAWAYPQKAVFTLDDSRVFIGMAGGTPKADLTNRFGSANAVVLRAERDKPDSIFAGTNPPPGYSLYQGPSFKSPRLAATLQSFDADADQLSDQLEAFNRWNSLRQLPGDDPENSKKLALVSTSVDQLTNPAVPLPPTAFPDDAMDKSFFLPASGIGYRCDDYALPRLTLNAGSRSAVAAIERLGRLWHEAYLAGQVSRPYFVVGAISTPGGGPLKGATGELLQYNVRNGFQVNFPYFSTKGDEPYDFVSSNGPNSPRDNSGDNYGNKPSGFDKANTARFLALLLAENSVKKIEIDPAVRDVVEGVNFGDSRFELHGSRTPTPRENHSRRDLDSQMSVSFSPLAIKIEPKPPTPEGPRPPGRTVYTVTLPDHLSRDKMQLQLTLPPTEPEAGQVRNDGYIVRKEDGTVLQLGPKYDVSELFGNENSITLTVDMLNGANYQFSAEVFSPELDNVYSLHAPFQYVDWTAANNPLRRLAALDPDATTPDASNQTKVEAETIGFTALIAYRRVKWVPASDDRPTGSPSEPQLDPQSGVIIAGKDQGTLYVEAFAIAPSGNELRAKTLAIEVGTCDSCSAGSCPMPGKTGVALGSVEFWVSDGNNGKLQVKRTSAGADLVSRALLEYPYDDKDTRVVLDAQGAVRQVLTAEVLIDVRPEGSGYVVATYPNTGTVQFDSALAVYQLPQAATAVSTLTVAADPVSGDNGVLVTTNEGRGAERYAFRYSPATNAWTLLEQLDAEGNALREQSIATTTAELDGQPVTQITRVTKGRDGTVASKQVDSFANLPAGRRLVATAIDPDGANYVTRYTYTPQGLVESIVYPEGRWVRFAYDGQQRVTKRIEPWLNAAPDAAESACVVTTYDYTPLTTTTGLAPLPKAPRTTVVSVLGTETARSYDHYENNVHRSIVAVKSGAAWDDATNLVTTTTHVASGVFAGNVASVLSPDGTMAFYEYRKEATGEVTTVRRGAPNAARNAIVDGTITTSRQNRQGNEIASSVVDVASGLKIDERTALETDAAGRVLSWHYLDGSTSSIEYGCCGIDSETDRRGITTTYDYDALKRVSVQHRQGITTLYEYDVLGRVTKTTRRGTDASNIVTSRTEYLDALGESVDTYDAAGRKTQLRVAHNENGSTTRTTTLPGGFTQIEITARDGQRLQSSGTAAAPMLYQYRVDTLADEPYVVTRTIARVLDEETQEYRDTEWTETWSDMAGRPVRIDAADGSYAENAYNAKNQLVRSVDPDGVTTLFGYNARSERTVTAVDMNSNGAIDYAGLDRITRTSVSYAAKTWETHSITVARTVTEIWPEANDETSLVVSTDEQSVDGAHAWSQQAEAVTHQETSYPAIRNGSWTVKSTAPDGTSAVQTYANGRLASVSQLSTLNSQLSSVTYAYDPHGRQESVTDARLGTTTYSYYDDDQIKTITAPHPEVTGQTLVTTNFYNDRGLLERRKLPDDSEVFYTYTPQGQLDRVHGSQTYPLDYDYDAQGRMIAMTTWKDFAGDTGKAKTQWLYDGLRGQLQAKRYTDASEVGYAYTAAGRLHTRTWARGTVTTYGYHPDGSLASVDYGDTTPDISYAYYRHGRVQEVRDGVLAEGAIAAEALRYRHAFSYDDALRPSTETIQTAGSYELTRSYEGSTAGEVPGRYRGITLTAAGSSDLIHFTSYGYDSSGRIQKVTSPAGVFTYGYVPNSNLLETITSPVHTATNVYQPRGTSILSRTNAVGQNVISRYGYTLNALGQRTAMISSGSAFPQPSHVAYQYNEKGEVIVGNRFEGADPANPGAAIAADSHFYRYDDIGNRKLSGRGAEADPIESSSYTSNLLNQYTEISLSALNAQPSTLVHDPDGDLTDDDRWHYTWNGENRLIAMETQPAAVLLGLPKQRLEFAYDYQGRRVHKKVLVAEGSTGNWSLVTDLGFAYDGWNLIAENSATGSPSTVNRTYTWGLDLSNELQGAGGVGGLLAVTDGEATPSSRFTAYDANGNVTQYLDSSGVINAHFDYSPFAETVRATGFFTPDASFRFSTKYADLETDLLYYGLRYYSPPMGRWIGRDALEEQGGVNLCGFLGNDGINDSDLFGLFPFNKLLRRFCKLKACEREEFLAKLGTKKIQFFKDDGKNLRLLVYEDANGVEYTKSNGPFGGTIDRSRNLIYVMSSHGYEEVLTSIFHESDHLDNDVTTRPTSFQEAIDQRAANEERAFTAEADFAFRVGITPINPTIVGSKGPDAAEIKRIVDTMYKQGIKPDRRAKKVKPVTPAAPTTAVAPAAPTKAPPKRDRLIRETHTQTNDGPEYSAADFKCP
ncbi:hypothetical protein Oter_3067 [Opitutus terrae PB90-1]|uniref:Teneurin-like YD-shell domain-containing protein n=2 Tax=Opitutus terrae TaxID=107709 RepID=B1ZZE4_OPITP|nr:hypothetical protein Oter_3067 [Opitutus terrae PB90-1]